MEELVWPLTVLSRSIHYKNITAASQNIGLSQPQISRLILKLEQELEIKLLDKSSPRDTKWTYEAKKLVEIYDYSSKKLEHSINNLKEQSIPKNIYLGTLEGLSSLATKYAHYLLHHFNINLISLDIFDQNDIEAKFLQGDLDLIFTSRIPSKKKFTFQKLIGHQSFNKFQSNKHFKVLSSFEYNLINKDDPHKKFVSNSLQLRKNWLGHYGGLGQIPGELSTKKSKEFKEEVYTLAQDHYYKDFWDIIEKGGLFGLP